MVPLILRCIDHQDIYFKLGLQNNISSKTYGAHQDLIFNLMGVKLSLATFNYGLFNNELLLQYNIHHSRWVACSNKSHCILLWPLLYFRYNQINVEILELNIGPPWWLVLLKLYKLSSLILDLNVLISVVSRQTPVLIRISELKS